MLKFAGVAANMSFRSSPHLEERNILRHAEVLAQQHEPMKQLYDPDFDLQGEWHKYIAGVYICRFESQSESEESISSLENNNCYILALQQRTHSIPMGVECGTHVSIQCVCKANAGSVLETNPIK